MEQDNKYRLTEEIKEHNGATLHRIEALQGFSDVEAGKKGGWIEKEDNLSHEGDCWVYKDACVYDNAQVSGNACIYDNAQVYDNAQINGDAKVFGSARVFGDVKVFGNAWVFGSARVFGDAQVFRTACVYHNAQVYGDAQVSGNARLQIGKYDEGKITETPMVIISSLFVVNKCGNGIFIGCKKLTAEEWLGDKGKELAIENDFTEKEINEYKKIIQFITKF